MFNKLLDGKVLDSLDISLLMIYSNVEVYVITLLSVTCSKLESSTFFIFSINIKLLITRIIGYTCLLKLIHLCISWVMRKKALNIMLY